MLASLRTWILTGWKWFLERLSRGGKVPGLSGTSTPTLSLFVLPAHNGDALLLQYPGEDDTLHHIWIDGGLAKTYREYTREIIRQIRDFGSQLDLMVVTHIDQDHIGGVLAFLEDPEIENSLIRNFWFNSSVLISQYFKSPHHPEREIPLASSASHSSSRSIGQGMKLEEMLSQSDMWHDQPILGMQAYELQGAQITVLSPDTAGLKRLHRKWEVEDSQMSRSLLWEENDYEEALETLIENKEEEDDSIANGSSIGFLFEFEGKSLLLLGDAKPSVVAHSLQELGYTPRKPMKVDYVKLSHHCSKKSISTELLSLIQCRNFIISTDGSRYGLPHKEALARILLHPNRKAKYPIRFFFNHNNDVLRSIFTEGEKQKYNFQCIYPGIDEQGLLIEW